VHFRLFLNPISVPFLFRI